jgi:hypothetical protein
VEKERDRVVSGSSRGRRVVGYMGKRKMDRGVAAAVVVGERRGAGRCSERG